MNSENLSIEERYELLKINGFNSSHLEIKTASDKGLGVFARQLITKGSIIEYSHCIVLEYPEKYMRDRGIRQYHFLNDCNCEACKRHGKVLLIALGYGSIYNCSESEAEANCRVQSSLEKKLIVFTALRDINPNEEILCWFGQNYYDIWCKKNNA
jgi:SET domain-containing protein